MSQSALTRFAQSLETNKKRLENTNLSNLFNADKDRATRFSMEWDGLFLDYSKNNIDAESWETLLELVDAVNLSGARQAMFDGEKINTTEDRAVLHSALRAGAEKSIKIDGADIIPDIQRVLSESKSFSERVRRGEYQVSGGKITDVINIGIGGSDLGPVMVSHALAPYQNGPNIHFVSNVDGADFHDTTLGLDPETTLIIIASKTFTTAETMANANLARNWLAKKIPNEQIGKHFAALSTNLEATGKFGIAEENTFGFWDWVGGRYSLWSSIGLSIMIGIGADNFEKILAGARATDEHFCNAPVDQNIPVILALLGIWYRNFWDYRAHAVLPYDNRLLRFPAYLQQLDMESNGKHICKDGSVSRFTTGPLIWGEPGTNGQHAFYQLLHQGTDITPCDFLVGVNAHEEDQTHQKMLVANCFAQSEAMMIGRSYDQVVEILRTQKMSESEIVKIAPHKIFGGNRPSNTIVYDKLTPYALGQLIAIYEHKVFVQGVIWDINSFDQWGVELGKELAKGIEPLLEEKTKDGDNHDGSTMQLINHFRSISTS